jgi:hypothetical protein
MTNDANNVNGTNNKKKIIDIEWSFVVTAFDSSDTSEKGNSSVNIKLIFDDFQSEQFQLRLREFYSFLSDLERAERVLIESSG